MDGASLRQTVQNALVCEIFARPPDPSFTLGRTSSFIDAPRNPGGDQRPTWISELHHRFNQSFLVEGPDYEPFVIIAAWYVNGDSSHACMTPHDVRLTNDPTAWRTDIVFSWRTNLIRAAAADFVTVQGFPTHPLTQVSQHHVIMSQGLSEESIPVLVTVQCVRHDAFPNRQFAYVFQTRTVTNIIASVSVPSQFHHLPFVVQLRGLTYLPGEVVLLQPGNHLLVLVATPEVDPFTDQVVDGFSLLQTVVSSCAGTLNCSSSDHRKSCKPAPFDEDNDLPMTFEGPRITRPRRPHHNGNLDWMEDLVRAIRLHGVFDPWHGVINLQVVTWFVNHASYPVCRQPRITHFTGEVITWIDDLRTTWADLLDRTTTFSVHVVHPRPPGSVGQGQMLHLLLEQSRPVHYAAVLVTARFSGFTDEGILQGAYSTPDRLELQMLTNLVGIAPHCHERLCHININHLLLPAGVFFDVATGHSVRIRIEPLDTSTHQVAQMPVQPTLPLRELHDETNLMQLRTGLLWQPRRGQQLSHTPVTSAQFPHAPLFTSDACSSYESSEFVQVLRPLWQDLAFSWEGEAHSAQVVTWFLDQWNHHQVCCVPRTATLFDNSGSWEEQLRLLWDDHIQDGRTIEFHVVTPAPPVLEPGVAAHVLITQVLRDDWISILISSFKHGSDQRPYRMALTTHELLSFDGVVQIVETCCPIDRFSCRLWHAQHQLLGRQHYRGRSGLCLVIHKSQTVDRRNDEHAVLCSPGDFPPASPISDADDKAVDFHTWFVHAVQQKVCYQPMTVRSSLELDVADVFRSAWFDKVGDCPLQYCTFASQLYNERHVIGWPIETSPEVVAVLIEAQVTGDHEPMTVARVALVQAHSSATHLGLIFGINLATASERQQQCCQFWYKGISYNWKDSLVLESGTTVAIEWDSRTIASLPLSIDFTPVFEVHDWLDTHFVLPTFDLPAHFPWLPSSRQWTQEPWWEPRFMAYELRLYYDGSSFRKADSAVVGGAAVAAFMLTADGWMFAGAVSTSLKPGTSSYLAELDAAIIAHKLAHDLLKTCAVSQGFIPQVEFWFDSVTVGNQAAGKWQICSHPRTGQFVRCLHRWIESRFKTELRHRHVKAHSGEPGNELVDVLAFQAAMGSPTQDWQDWLAHATTASFVEAAEWLWFLYRPDVSWDGTKALLPAGPATRPATNVFPTGDQQKLPTTQSESGHLNLICATCNFLSLKPSGKISALGGDAVVAGPARQDSLLQQFHEAGVHLFAWQETRLRRHSNQHDSRFWLFRSPANAQGHYGVIIGLNRLIPFGKITGDVVEVDSFMMEHHIDIVAAEPRFLILRIAHPLLRCIVVGGHAPHTGADDHTIHSWWNTLDASIPHKYDAWDRILLVDANARVGAEPSRHIGDHQAEQQDPKAEPFVTFVASQGLWLPATFAAYHTGLGATWRHSRGHWFRNDFIGIPLAWPLSHCRSWVSSDIDVGLAKEDHRTVMLHLQRQVVPFQAGQRPRQMKLQIDLASSAPLEDLANLATPGWQLDVHTHASELQSSIVEHVWPWRASFAPKPRRTTMTATTWELVKEKREVRNLLHERSHTQRQTLLAAWFAAWKHASCDCTAPELFHSYDSLLMTQDRLIAVALLHFRVLGARVVKSLRQDDITFYQDLLTDCTAFLHPAEAKNLWKVVRRSLPKFQQRRSMVGPARLAELEDQWLPHFSDLEAGTTTNATDLVDHCHFMQTVRRLDASLEVQLGDLPSLFQLEQAFRAISEGKATGYDPLPSEFFHKAAAPLALLYHDLFLKEYLWQSEPIQNKGGPMAIIPKQLQPSLAKQFRGILLLSNAGKRAHAILRGQIMGKLERTRAPGQLGGFPGQQVLYGSQAIRTFGTICDQHGISSAILFLDLSSAFHHLVREAVVGSCDGCNLAPVMATLMGSGHPIDKFQHFARLPGILAELGLSDPIVRLLQDIHICTWCTIHDRWLLHTHRGTRPGSPLADIVFHALMARIAQAMDEWLTQCSEYQNLLHSLEIDVPTILWADDIAIPLATHTADAIVPFLQLALAKAHDLLSDAGFLLNFSKGKTSAVITFRGKGSGDLRKRFQLCPIPGVQCQFSDGSMAWLHFVASYKHLGTIFASNHDLMCELRVRVGTAKAAFAQLSKPILTNKNLPIQIRLQMFHCLIATKLFFGLGAWTTPAPKQLQYLQGALVGLLRRVLRLGRTPYTAEQILAKANVGDVRTRLAVDRLLYAQRLFRTGPPFLHCLLHREFDCSDLSWLHGLQADLTWFNDVLPGQLPGNGVTDLTEIILMWQNPHTNWNALVRRAWKMHLRQNSIMADARKLHGDIFRNLRSAGATFTSVAQDWEELGVGFDCFCGKRFETQRGLLAHQRKTHAMFSLERKFLQGCTCLHCGKFLWSTQRLQQHLSYIPKGLGYNPCYLALSEQNRCVEYERVDLGTTTRVAGLTRREALQTLGPSVLQDPVWQQQRSKISAELQQCLERVEIVHHPDNPSEASESLGNQLSFVTLDWFYRYYPQGPDDREKQFLADAWVQTLCDFTFAANAGNDLDPWVEMVFLAWGEHWLPDVIATLEDGVAEADIDSLFADFAAELDRYRLLARIAHLEHCLAHCMPTVPTAHRPIRREGLQKAVKVNTKTQQRVIRAFAQQMQWQTSVRGMKFFDLPQQRPMPKILLPDGTTAYLVLHLFSGRRRTHDVHFHLHELCRQRGITVVVLSLDTAVSLEFGDLMIGSPSWNALLQIYESGLVAASVVGSPCETFSEARFMPAADDDKRACPRPLRSADMLFGLEGLTLRELKQCHVGGNFFQQGVLALSFHMRFGGCFISEHPAKPCDPSRPSIWTSAILETLLEHPEAHLTHVAQYKWGASAIKPTGLLHFNLETFRRDIYQVADPHAQKPTQYAIGRDNSGCFRTAMHKEYPNRFCLALAYAIVQKIASAERRQDVCVREVPFSHLVEWIQGAARASSAIYRGTWLPDYQL